MQLLVAVILAGLASLGAGLLVAIGTSELLPCYEDRASCGLGEFFGVFGVCLYAPIAMLAYGLTFLGSQTEEAIKKTMLWLLAAVGGFMVFGLIVRLRSGGVLFDIRRDYLGFLQFYVPLALVPVLQWLALRWYLRGGDKTVSALASRWLGR